MSVQTLKVTALQNQEKTNQANEEVRKLMEKKQKQLFQNFKFVEDIQHFVKGLDMGDLILDNIIDFAYVLYGQSKTGKTATSHLIAGSVLIGKKIHGSMMVEPMTSKHKEAKVGNSGNSQTEIPNILFTKQGKYILDTPGYGDTYGVLRILANAFYHYRLYSKVKNMKFILSFQKTQLMGGAEKFIHTIMQFSNSYIDLDFAKKYIWKCSCFLITKCEDIKEEEQIQNIKDKLISLRQTLKTSLQSDADIYFREYIDYIVSNDRIFIIKTPKQGEILEYPNLLSKIDKKIGNWHSRQVIDQYGVSQVDMSKISLKLGKQINISITKSPQSKNQFKEVIQYYNLLMEQILNSDSKTNNLHVNTSFNNILNQIVKDAMDTLSLDSHNFINTVKNIGKYSYDKYDQSCNDKRQKKQQELFLEKQDNTSSSIKKTKDKNYKLKQFNVIEEIQKIKNQYNSLVFTKHKYVEIQKINQFEKYFINIIKQINKISYKKANRAKILAKYAYSIYRILEQTKIFLLLLNIEVDDDIKKALNIVFDGKGFAIVKLIQDCMGTSYTFQEVGHTYSELRTQYVEGFEISDENLKKMNITDQLIEFFMVGDKLQQKSIMLILKFSDQLIIENSQKRIAEAQFIQKIIKRLISVRIGIQNILVSGQTSVDDRNKNINLIRKTSNNIAKLYEIIREFDHSLQAYKSIKFVSSACRIYDCLIDRDQRNVELRLDYSKYLIDHFRSNKAIEVLQDAFEIVEDIQRIQIIKSQISTIRQNLKTFVATDYEQQLANSFYFTNFDQYKLLQAASKKADENAKIPNEQLKKV